MEQKYVLEKKDNILIIRELAETEPGKFAMLYEEKLETELLEAAIKEGKRQLFDLLRSNNFYPPSFFAEKVVNGIVEMFEEDPKDKLTIECNDIEALYIKDFQPFEIAVDEKELAEIDKLLEDEDDVSDDFED